MALWFTEQLRTAYFFVTGTELPQVEFSWVRGLSGVKEAEIEIAGHKIRIAVAHGLGNVEYVVNKVRDAKKAGKELPYHFIEVMGCPGGCVTGGGQPRSTDPLTREKRING